MDVSVYDAIFSKEEGLGSIFTYDETSFQYVLEDVFPIRLNRIEREALFAVAEFAYSEGILVHSIYFQFHQIVSYLAIALS